jgi:hypothetical protein
MHYFEGLYRAAFPKSPGPRASTISSNSTLHGTSGNENSTISIYRWLWEIAAAIFSIACTAAVVVVLSVMDQKSLSSWTSTRLISPNALVSIFVILGKFSLIVPVASSISQLKWIHFKKPNRLHDLETFDQASRGRAIGFLWKIGFKAPLAAWGSLIYIISLGIDPFSQEALSYPSRQVLVNDSRASAAVSQVYVTNNNVIPGGSNSKWNLGLCDCFF